MRRAPGNRYRDGCLDDPVYFIHIFFSSLRRNVGVADYVCPIRSSFRVEYMAEVDCYCGAEIVVSYILISG